MKTRTQVLLAVSVLSLGLWSGSLTGAFAEGEASTASDATASEDWKEELSSAKQQIKEQKKTIKDNAHAARQEEKDLRDQIREAAKSGDVEKAKSLKEQLKAMHKENVQQIQQDLQGLRETRKSLRSDVKEARLEKLDTNKDGTVDDAERKAFREKRQKFDRDNNPPGPKGGPGTNWENRPGPKGGPGTSPDYRRKKDRDYNPPGPRGGRGTNWENRPGPKGGPGASPDRGLHKGYNRGVRDYGKGIGKGKGQGPLHRKK